ncbi:GNAT family N-acetyltransferase [Amedibacillus sp. YH-ame10]
MDVTNNKILYADMINSMQLGATVVYEDEHALLLHDVYSSIYYAAANTKESAKKMIQMIPDTFDILVTHDTICNEVLKEDRNIEFENVCYHCAYLSQKPLEISLEKGYEIKPLNLEHMQEVIDLYGKEMPTLANEEYISLNIKSGMLGMFYGDDVCGFVGVHEGGYGSIGMLEIKPQYKRLGLATMLERAMINLQLERGRIPYGEIFQENAISLKLQHKVRMQVGKDLTYWFYM